MEEEEILLVVKNTCDFMNIQTRAYRDKKLLGYYSNLKFPKDYIDLYQNEIFKEDQPIGIYYTEEDLYFGFMNIFGYLLVVGPTSEIELNEKKINNIACQLGCNQKEKEEFCNSMMNSPCVPVSTIILMMCIGYHQLTGIKLSIIDKIRENGIRKNKFKISNEKQADSLCRMDETMMINETMYQFERKCVQVIQMGNEEDMDRIINECSTVIPWNYRNNLRYFKNLFIKAATMASRTAAECGVAAGEAFSLADYYIERCESLEQSDTIANLMARMLKNFVVLVKRVSENNINSELLVKVNGYIQKRISEKITVERMAYDFGMSRNSLSGKFKQETGYILSEYILMKKIDRAKFILSTTDYSFAEISAYLAFSSQSHFQRAFKKYVNMTPNEFRKKKI